MGKNNREYKSIFVCLTSYQYIISDIIAKGIFTDNNERSLIILKYVYGYKPTNNNYADYIIIPKSTIGKIKTIWYSFNPGWKLHFKQLYYFNDRDPITKNIAKYCNIKILIEEGLGTYFGVDGILPIGKTIKPDKAYVGFPNLYKKNHSKFCICNKLDYKSIFIKDNIEKYISYDINYPCVDVLFIGQSVDDKGIILNEELKLIKELSQDSSYSILIKPHPRDVNPIKYKINSNVLIIDRVNSILPIEVFAHKIQAKAIMTLYSSSAITLSTLYPEKTIILTYKIYNNSIQISKEIEQFAKLCNIKVPESIEELKKMII